MISDPIADFLTRIRNAQARKKDSVSMPATKMIVAIASILKAEGFIADYRVEEAKPQSELVVDLKYVNGVPAISQMVRVSKPGVRKYRGYREIKPVRRGLGLSIFSTPMGIVSGKEAVKSKIGGEYICYVY
jgi:small subunit ribosomal protein S8